MKTTNRNYDINYDLFYKNNNAIIFCYKSNRKNSSSSDIITINHLTSKDTDRTVSDDRIMNQIAGTIEKIVYYCKQYKRIELSCYVDVSKQAEYENANNELYHDVENQRYNFQRVTFSSIEQCINFVFSVYCLIYPYNKISKKTLFNNASIRYFINQYYN